MQGGRDEMVAITAPVAQSGFRSLMNKEVKVFIV